MMTPEPNTNYTNSALRIGDIDTYPARQVGEFIGRGSQLSSDRIKHDSQNVGCETEGCKCGGNPSVGMENPSSDDLG